MAEPRQSRRAKKAAARGQVFIQSTFNNTIVTITDGEGNSFGWASAGTVGFKGTKKGTPFAAQVAASNLARRAAEAGMKRVDIFVKGPGSGTRNRDPRDSGFRLGSRLDPRRDADSAQRLPSEET